MDSDIETISIDTISIDTISIDDIQSLDSLDIPPPLLIFDIENENEPGEYVECIPKKQQLLIYFLLIISTMLSITGLVLLLHKQLIGDIFVACGVSLITCIPIYLVLYGLCNSPLLQNTQSGAHIV